MLWDQKFCSKKTDFTNPVGQISSNNERNHNQGSKRAKITVVEIFVVPEEIHLYADEEEGTTKDQQVKN